MNATITIKNRKYTVSGSGHYLWPDGSMRLVVEDAKGNARSAMFTSDGEFDCWDNSGKVRANKNRYPRVNMRR